jgi:hypothetical protein
MTVYNVGALKGVYNQTGRHFLSLLPLIAVTLDLGQEEADAGPASPQRMTLPVAAFLPRWLLHVSVPQTRVVRCYGLYQQTHAKPLASCRTALGQVPLEVPVCLDWQTLCAQRGEAHPERMKSHKVYKHRVEAC